MKKKQCSRCKEPTRRITGFADGKHTAYCLYGCDNTSCDIYQEKQKEKEQKEKDREAVTAKNMENGVFIQLLRQARQDRRVLIFQMAQALSIRPSEYSAFEYEKAVMPKGLYEKAMNLLDVKNS